MKKAYFLLALVCVSFFSCTKKNSDTANQPKTYIVQGLTDVTVMPNTSVYLYLNVQYVGPTQEHVALSFEGIPPGISIDSQGSLSGIPTFNAAIYFVDNSARRGNYHAKLICTGSQTGQKSYDFYIRVGSCGDIISGLYTQCTSCNSTIYTDNISVDSSSLSRIYFSNFAGKGISIYAELTCGSTSFTIPSQIVGGKSYFGSGTFSPSYLDANYEIDSAGYTTYCYFNMSR